MTESNIEKKLLNIPFDQFSRQYVAWKLIDEHFKGSKDSFSVLDIGGYKGVTADFFPKNKVTVLDTFDIDEPNYVRGDGASLPFEDNEFSVTTSFDVLEHIPQANREAFVKEQLRVAARASVLACPVYTKEAAEAERVLNEYHSSITDEPHEWLNEHIENGLPQEKDIENWIHQAGYHYHKIYLNPLHIWAALQFGVFETANSPVSTQHLEEAYKFYNTHVETIDINPNTTPYRALYFITPKATKAFSFPLSQTEEHIIETYHLLFKHLRAMKHNLVAYSLRKERNWYNLTIVEQQKKYQQLESLAASRGLELDAIKQSKGWKLVRLLQKTKAIFIRRPRGKQQ